MSPTLTEPERPSKPDVKLCDVVTQFWTDVRGKEVEDPGSYSYTWVAIQFGHVAVGFLVYFMVTLVVYLLRALGMPGWWFPVILGVLIALAFRGKEVQGGTHPNSWIGIASRFSNVAVGILVCLLAILVFYMSQIFRWSDWWLPVILGVLGVSGWELTQFIRDGSKISKNFPLDRKLLAANALIAALYMILGVVVGSAITLQDPWARAGIFVVVLVLAVAMAPSWLIQKIIWQKAALPFLYRLADVNDQDINNLDAKLLTEFVNEAAPPELKGRPPEKVTPRQIVIGGPIGSGRSEMAAAIGTEFAFKGRKVRYVTLTALLEFAQRMPAKMQFTTSSEDRNDAGPDNIRYWSWADAQVLIIDDVGPLISAISSSQSRLNEFKRILQQDLANIEDVLKACHTIWVVGSDNCTETPKLIDVAKAVTQHCGGAPTPGAKKALVIQLTQRRAPTKMGPAHVQVGKVYPI